MYHMLFNDYLVQANKFYYDHRPAMRLGQAYFNFLHMVRPGIAEAVRGDPKRDPFYKDENVPAFIYFISSVWETGDEEYNQ